MDNEEYPKLGIQYKAEETTENTEYKNNEQQNNQEIDLHFELHMASCVSVSLHARASADESMGMRGYVRAPGKTSGQLRVGQVQGKTLAQKKATNTSESSIHPSTHPSTHPSMNVVDESAPQVMVGSSSFIFGEFLHPGNQKPS